MKYSSVNFDKNFDVTDATGLKIKGTVMEFKRNTSTYYDTLKQDTSILWDLQLQYLIKVLSHQYNQCSIYIEITQFKNWSISLWVGH